LRTFMRDRLNQVVLGTFVASFVYCLIVLRTIRRAEEVLFVPHLSVTFAVFLALASVGVLIVFIHHVSVSIQADEVVARVGEELLHAIDRLYPGEPDAASATRRIAAELPAGFDDEARRVAALGDGYLQRVDREALVEVAQRHDLILRTECSPGRYVVEGQTLVAAWPADRVDVEVDREIQTAFVLGNQRTEAQDVQFPVHQLVEISVRALSPGINDPFTAIACVDRLGSALTRLASREPPSVAFPDERGQLRLVAHSVTFPTVAENAFDQIRPYARSSTAVAMRMLEVIAVVVEAAVSPASREALRRAAAELNADAQETLTNAKDRGQIALRYQAVQRALEGR
jgi:uncharacterized membrane protein